MTHFVNSTVQTIHDDMLLYGCDPGVVTDVCAAMEGQPVLYQIILLDKMEGYDRNEIALHVGIRPNSVSRIIHTRLTCLQSLMEYRET